jgi:hypothetical protein
MFQFPSLEKLNFLSILFSGIEFGMKSPNIKTAVSIFYVCYDNILKYEKFKLNSSFKVSSAWCVFRRPKYSLLRFYYTRHKTPQLSGLERLLTVGEVLGSNLGLETAVLTAFHDFL